MSEETMPALKLGPIRWRKLFRNFVNYWKQPATWLGAALVAMVVAYFAASAYLENRYREDLYTTAFVRMYHQEERFIFPTDLMGGIDMIAAAPDVMLEKLIAAPVEMCRMIRCQEEFGVTLDEEAIITLATAVRDVKARRDAADGVFWARLISGFSLAMALFAFAVNTLRPAVVSPPREVERKRFPTPEPRRKVRPTPRP